MLILLSTLAATFAAECRKNEKGRGKLEDFGLITVVGVSTLKCPQLTELIAQYQ